MAAPQGNAIVVGVGSEQSLGAALSRRFAREGYNVIVSGRTEAKLARVVRAIVDDGGKAEAVVADATIEADVIALFDRAETGSTDGLDLVAFNAGNNAPHDFRTMPAEFFEQTWRVATLGGFLVGREAARRLAPRGRGTIIFTGATASLRGRAPFTAFASAKAGLRSLAQSMAREFGPLGIHVGHVVIDGGIDGEKAERRCAGSQDRARYRWVVEHRCHRGSVLASASATSVRLDARARSPAVQGAVLESRSHYQETGEDHGTAKRKDRGIVVCHGRSELPCAFAGQAAELYLRAARRRATVKHRVGAAPSSNSRCSPYP
jgi:NAD(P)-dependent dehydrogenase (short-subunit alcohol dehydrogenase family)